MKILVLVKRFSIDGTDLWLPDDLVHSMLKLGHSVNVVLYDLSGTWEQGEHIINDKLKVLAIPIDSTCNNDMLKKIIIVSKVIFATYRCRKIVSEEYDLSVGFSMAAFFFLVQKLLKNTSHRTLILWDFYPIHFNEIGKLNSRLLSRLLYWIENKSIRMHDSVALMTQRNHAFFESYHSNFEGKTFVLPLWQRLDHSAELASTEEINIEQYKKFIIKTKFNVIFGGQITEGRGVEQIVDIADRYRNELKNINFIIAGDGNLRSGLEERANQLGLGTVKFVGHLPQERYLDLVKACDATIVITVPNVSIPSFPSKALKYMLCKKPIIAAVEESSDFGEYIENIAKCGLYSPIWDMEKLVQNILRLSNDEELYTLLGTNGHRALYNLHDVDIVVKNLLKETALEDVN